MRIMGEWDMPSGAWSPPAGMTPQDNPGQPKDGIGDLIARFRAFQVEVRDKYNNLLKQAGIRVEKDLVRFVGAVRIEGTLDLPAGIIGNDALTSPVEVGDFDHSETAFDPVTGSGSWPTVSAVTLTVPDGFSQAVVTAVAYAAIRNTTPSTSTLIHCRALVAGVGGPSADGKSDPGVWSTVLAALPTRVPGLSGGGTFVVACQAYAGADFAADADNVATISGTVLWLR